MTQAIQFNEILEIVDSLTLVEQNELIDIIKHRQIQQRRDEIAQNISIAKEEYKNDKVFRGTVDDVITELDND